MKKIRKWSRLLHRDIGFFFIGTSLVYGLSGIALNHLNDWNPNYSVNAEQFNTSIDLSKDAADIDAGIMNLLDEINYRGEYKKHYYPDKNTIKIFLDGGSSIVVDLARGHGRAEYLKKRPVFYSVNYLHYNPNDWWMWFSDIFAGALIFFALSSLFMVRGKKGIAGSGGIYTLLGIVIPIIFLVFL